MPFVLQDTGDLLHADMAFCIATATMLMESPSLKWIQLNCTPYSKH